MKRTIWLLVLLTVGILMPRLSSAQVEAPLDTLTEEEAILEGAVLLPQPPIDTEEDLAPPEDDAPLLVDEPTSPDEEVSQAEEEDLGDFQVQEADPDGMLPPDDPATDADIQEAGAEDEEEVVEAPEAVIPADDAPEDPEALLTGEDLEIEEIVLPPELELYTPPSLEETGEEYPELDEEPAAPELPGELGQPPVLQPLESREVDEGQTLEFPVNAGDPDPGQTVTVHASALPAGANFDGTTFSWTPSFFQAGTYTVTFAAVDDGPFPQMSPEQTITITVHDVNLPPLAAVDSLVTNEDEAAQPLDLLANDVDLDDDAITVISLTPGTGGILAPNEDGTYTYTPNPDFNGVDSLTYAISDGRGGTGIGTVRVIVTPVNDPPTFVMGPDQTVDEDAGPQTVVGWATGISPGPADEAGQTLTFTVTGGDEILFAVLPAITADGTLTYTPAPDASGSAKLTVSLADDGEPAGAVPKKGGKTQLKQVFTITVNPVNDPPVLAQIAPQTVDEGQLLTFDATATDVDGAVSLSIDGLPSGASFIDHQDGTATFTWTPGYDQAGTYTVTVIAGDGELSVGQSVVLTVVNVTRTVTAAAGDHGSITPAGATLVDYGSDQTFAIAAETGYRIEDVLVDGASVGPVDSYTFSGVTTDHAISASFLINTYNLTATAGIGGAVTPAGVTTVTYGSGQTYTIAPGAGYAVAEVQVDGVSVGPVGSYAFSNVTADHAINASFVDIAPPVVTLAGAEPLVLELGTPYTESGATAADQADGDLTDQIQISGVVDVNTEGAYTVTYTAIDPAGNTGTAARTVQVVVTPNSYGLIATHSLDLRAGARLHSGFAGVVERGERPFLAGRTELVVGTRVQTAPAVRLSAPRVRVRDNATIGGRLVYTELTSVGRRTTIGQRQQVPAGYFPLFQGFGLPVFQSGIPGSRDVEVKQRGSISLSAGAYDEVRVKERGTLTFTGGTYQVADLEIGQQAKVVFLGPTVLLIRGQLTLGERASFAPAVGVAASDIRVYVEGRNGRLGLNRDDRDGNDDEDDAEGRDLRLRPRATQIGQDANFQANLYAPNGTVDLRQGSIVVGSVIARDVIVGVRAQVAVQSGWLTPGVVYQPAGAVLPLAKLAVGQDEAGTSAARPTGTGLQANYPNPFNPSTSIPYALTEAVMVKLTVFNLIGQQVRVLVDQLQVPGSYRATWDGLDAAGAQVAGGVYLVRLQAGDHSEVRKMLLAK